MSRRNTSFQRVFVTEDDLLATYTDKAQSLKALEHLAGRGIIPLRFPSPAFFDANRLSAWILWSGYMSVNKPTPDDSEKRGHGIRSPRYRCGIHVKDPFCRRDLE